MANFTIQRLSGLTGIALLASLSIASTPVGSGSLVLSKGASGLSPDTTRAVQQVASGLPASLQAGDKQVLAKSSNVFNEIAQKAVPAVVSITVVKSVNPHANLAALKGLLPDLPDAGGGPGAQGIDPFDDDGDKRALGIGSGMIIRPDGTILTNNHVIEDAEKITVTLDEKHKVAAHLVGTDPKTDLAVIKLNSVVHGLPTLSFGNSDQIKVGDWAIAIGSPFGLNRSVSSGIISAKGRAQMGILDVEDFIQTDAAINPGSSGGPLLNSNGEIIGVNTAIFSQGGGFMGIGFAIPSLIAREISDQLLAHGRVIRGWIGVAAQDLDENLASYFHSPGQHGALVSDVTPGGPGSRADLKPGDVVLRYNQAAVSSAGDFRSLVGKTRAGTMVPVDILRAGKPQSVAVTIQEYPEPKHHPVQQAGQAARGDHHPSIGLAVQDIPDEVAKTLKMGQNVGVLVVGVQPGSAAFDSGLVPGDIILKANKTAIHTAKEFAALAHRFPEDQVSMLYVQRGPQEKIFVPIRPEV